MFACGATPEMRAGPMSVVGQPGGYDASGRGTCSGVVAGNGLLLFNLEYRFPLFGPAFAKKK